MIYLMYLFGKEPVESISWKTWTVIGWTFYHIGVDQSAESLLLEASSARDNISCTASRCAPRCLRLLQKAVGSNATHNDKNPSVLFFLSSYYFLFLLFIVCVFY